MNSLNKQIIQQLLDNTTYQHDKRIIKILETLTNITLGIGILLLIIQIRQHTDAASILSMGCVTSLLATTIFRRLTDAKARALINKASNA